MTARTTRRLVAEDLVLCSGTVGRPPFETAVACAAATGFQGVSLYYDQVLEARARGWTDRAMRSYLADHDLAVAELDGRMAWLPGDRTAPGFDEFISTAAAVEARSVTVLEVDGRRPGEDLSLAEVATAFAAVCDRAAGDGLLAHIEYFPLSGIAELGVALEVVARAGRSNGGVMIDTWHHLRGPDAGQLDGEVPGGSILAVQLGDVSARPPASLRWEMMHGRLLPGHGAGAIATLLATLRRLGCRAPMEVEVYSDELVSAGPEVAARRAADAVRELRAGMPPSEPEVR